MELVERNPRMKTTELERALCQKFWELEKPQHKLEMWGDFPTELLEDRDHWSARLRFYYRRGEMAKFEDVRAGMNRWRLRQSETDWLMRLQLDINASKFHTAS